MTHYEGDGRTQMCEVSALILKELQPARSLSHGHHHCDVGSWLSVLPALPRDRTVAIKVILSQSSLPHGWLMQKLDFFESQRSSFIRRQPGKCFVFVFAFLAGSFLPLDFHTLLFPSFPLWGPARLSTSPPSCYLPNLWLETTWHFPGLAGIYRPLNRHSVTFAHLGSLSYWSAPAREEAEIYLCVPGFLLAVRQTVMLSGS